MTVKQFLANLPQTPVALNMMMDLLTILDEFDTESCSVFAGKIRAHLDEAKKKNDELTDVDLIDLCSYLDKLDTTGNQIYAIQFNERIEELMKSTGLSMPEIKNKAREYRGNR